MQHRYLKNSLEESKIPFGQIYKKGERDFGLLAESVKQLADRSYFYMCQNQRPQQ